MPAAGALAVWAVAVAAPVLTAYAQRTSPTRRALAAMREWQGPKPGALALHQTFQRPLEAEIVPVSPQLPSPPRREWLELARYWREGHVEPLWFLADPRRTDLALVDPASRGDQARVPLGFLVALPDRRDATGVGDVVSDGRAWVVCRRGLGADAGNGRHRPTDGPWTGPWTDYGLGAAAVRTGARARGRPAPRCGGGSEGADSR